MSTDTADPFQSHITDRIRQASKTKSMNAAANAIFGPTVDYYGEYFGDLKQDLKHADMDVLYRTYVSKIFLYSTAAFISTFTIGVVYSISSGATLPNILRLALGIPLALSIAFGGFMYIYPSHKAKSRKKSIDQNLPFALNHLGAIATSGISPSSMFELLAGFDEYGGISKEAEEISRRVNVFGEDFTTALREIAERSPSEDWSEVLYGILSTVETGGDLEAYLQEKAEEALFDFKMDRQRKIERLSTYASFYTAILIAAPVFLIVILAVMNLLGGSLLGFAIRDLMWLGVHVIIPVINLAFVIFLTLKVD